VGRGHQQGDGRERAVRDDGHHVHHLVGRTRSTFEILEADRPRSLRTRFKGLLLGGETLVTLEPDGEGTILQQTFKVSGIIASIMGRVFATGSYRGSFRGELRTFARLVEREAG
jgi:hypothetical protein